jgi:tetratricopeptide (TPR) repeat protein
MSNRVRSQLMHGDLLCILRRPMKPVRKGHVLALLALLALIVVGSGCDAINARREIKEANRLYKDGKFEEAAKLYESALAVDPTLAFAHHNLGVTYFKMFRAGDETPENKEVASKATDHLAKYLAAFPADNQIRDMMTRIWIDAGDYPKALAYWTKEHEAEPTNPDIIEKIAGINFKAGHWQEAIGWYQKQADQATDNAIKLAAYANIAKAANSKLGNNDMPLLGEQRIQLADLGIGALQKAEALDAKNVEVQNLFGNIYKLRALSHGVSWAAAMDRASMLAHYTRWVGLKKEADAAAAAAAAQEGAPPAGTPPPAKTGG